MKKIILSAFVAGLVIVSCSKKEDTVQTETTTDSVVTTTNDSIPVGDNSNNSLDWAGTYEGELPCADCDGIKTTLVLNADDTYTLTSEYAGKNEKTEEQGKVTWSADGNQIEITTKDGQTTKYIVGENQLIQLDQEGNRITGPLAEKYVLAKK